VLKESSLAGPRPLIYHSVQHSRQPPSQPLTKVLLILASSSPKYSYSAMCPSGVFSNIPSWSLRVPSWPAVGSPACAVDMRWQCHVSGWYFFSFLKLRGENMVSLTGAKFFCSSVVELPCELEQATPNYSTSAQEFVSVQERNYFAG